MDTSETEDSDLEIVSNNNDDDPLDLTTDEGSSSDSDPDFDYGPFMLFQNNAYTPPTPDLRPSKVFKEKVVASNIQSEKVKIEKTLDSYNKDKKYVPTKAELDEAARQAMQNAAAPSQRRNIKSEGTNVKKGSSSSEPEFSDEKNTKNLKKTDDVAGNMKATYMCYYCDKILDTHNEFLTHRDAHTDNHAQSRINRNCYVCKEDVMGYIRHIEENHKDFRPNVCKLCPNGKYQSHYDLKMHLYKHSDSKAFQCLACLRKFQRPAELRRHINKKNHSKNLYHCPHCGLGNKKFLEVNEHFKQEHDPNNMGKLYPCYGCKKICMQHKWIVEHVCDPSKREEVKKLEKSIAVDLQKCARCNQEFSNEDEFACHKFSVCLDDPIFMCTECGKECVDQHRLNLHKRMHDNHKVICDDCGQFFASERSLSRHKIVHISGRSFPCDQCCSTFIDKKALNHHLIIHKERQYECDLCGKKFRSYDSVKIHMATHDKSLQKVLCEDCGKTFVRQCDKNLHMRKFHTGGDKPLTHACHMCPKEYRDIFKLKRHIRSIHHDIFYECKHCRKRFNEAVALKDHLFMHRGFYPYNCVQCDKKYIKKYSFIKHLRGHNIKFEEKLHGYREKENMRKILADSLQNPEVVADSKFGVTTV